MAKLRRRAVPGSGVKLLACDMDGTLLNSSSRVLPSTVEALKAAIARGVTVMLATGKARPAAIACMQSVGLAGAALSLAVTATPLHGLFVVCGVVMCSCDVFQVCMMPFRSFQSQLGALSRALGFRVEHCQSFCLKQQLR